MQIPLLDSNLFPEHGNFSLRFFQNFIDVFFLVIFIRDVSNENFFPLNNSIFGNPNLFDGLIY